MRLTDGGYSTVMFNTAMLQETARALSTRIPEVMQEVDADCVAVTGKSGIALAFATLALVHFPIMVVRKAHEQSHGNRVEGTNGHNVQRYIVLDDFVCSGQTLRNIREAIEGYGGRHTEMVGALLYAAPGAWASGAPVPKFYLHDYQRMNIEAAKHGRTA